VKKIFLLISVIISIAAINSQSQSFLRAEGKTIVNESDEEVLLKGMGLGGWMLQEGYMIHTSDFAPTQHEFKEKITELIGEAGMNTFYDAWLANHVRKIDIDSLAAWGFNCVRLPMHYNLYTLPIEEEPVSGENTWLDKGFDLTDQLLSWCADNEMYLILDLHAAPGGQGYDAAISDYDSDKPSLWESKANRDKTVALWKKLAERYVDEKWIGGYDLINETNWNMDNNNPLKQLSMEITDSIRSVDQNHIIFIEGNWFANDFTNMTPPWDNNMVYSFHKYWSTNDQASIQWVLDIREQFNVPLWLGESGENSNTWFRDAIKLMDTHNIGWAWWPMKKIADIAGPLSINTTPEYEVLLDYWKKEADPNATTPPKPSAEYATDALMQLTENLKLENCEYNRDITHAMFAQVAGDVTIPYAENTIPGIIFATDFDIGRNNIAYYDKVVANYHVSTNNYTSWNDGWSYRNDGVDIQVCEDNLTTNGYNVGWIDGGEWMNYTVNVEQTGYYDISVRIAAEGSSGGSFHFEKDGIAITDIKSVPSTGGWQTWKSVFVRNVFLDQGTQTLKFVCDNTGFNLSRFNFIFKYEDITGLDDLNESSGIRVYPNPNSEILFIDSEKYDQKPKSYSLINSMGQTVEFEEINTSESALYSVDLKSYPNGMYLLTLDFGTNKRTFRVVLDK